MTQLVAELAALKEREVPPANAAIPISPHAAARLWSEGVALPEEADNYPRWYHPSPSRILRSADGKWVIRRQYPPLSSDVLSAHDTVSKALEEFERLQELGMDVISRGMTTSPMANTVLTISPWIPDLELCDVRTFSQDVEPLVDFYFSQRAGGVALRDLDRDCQYSWCAETGGRLLMHDPDPDLVLL